MTQHYSNPERESDPRALPDVEVFHRDSCFVRFGLHGGGCGLTTGKSALSTPGAGCQHEGWYWWTCSPGCLPDGDPVGPFESEAEALADAQANSVGSAINQPRYVACENCGHPHYDIANNIFAPCRTECPCDRHVTDDPLPPCVLSMRCYCAGHARGNAASEPCDTSEEQS